MAVRKFSAEDVAPMSDVDAAWLAGLIEGEGCIRLQVATVLDSRSRRPVDRVTLSISVGMKDRAVVSRVHSLCGGHIHVRGDGLTVATISSARALWVLKRIEPWMVGDKKPQALLAIEFQSGRIAGHRTPGRHAWEREAAVRISQMKRLGVYDA